MNDFFRQQTHMGIAVATGGQWGWVWVLLMAAIRGILYLVAQPITHTF